MTRHLVWLVMAFAPCPAVAQSPLATILRPAGAAAVDEAVRAEMAKQQVVGVAVAVIQNGRVVHFQGYGLADRETKTPVTPDTVINWGSNSKPLAAVAAMQLVQAGALDLDADVRRYVPDFPDKGAVITTRHLLAHQSGIPHYLNGKVVPIERKYSTANPFLDPIHSIDRFAGSPLLYKPGAKTTYSSYAYVLLSAVVQRAGKESFTTQVRDRIAKPLGMKSLQLDVETRGQRDWAVGYVKNGDGKVVPAPEEANYWKHGAGGYKSNVRDFAAWAAGLINRQLVSEATEKQMWAPQKLANGTATTWGLGFTVDDQGGLRVAHGGKQDEAVTRLVIYPKTRDGVVVMCNCGFADAGAFTTAVFAALKDKPTPDGGRPTGTRAFRMGFTGFVHDITPEAVTATRKFVRENGDVLAHHIEGVPWAEALSGQPFPNAILDEWAGKKSATPPKGKVYLAISPGRGDLKVADKGGPLPAELKGKAYDDPVVMKAYANYCRRAVEFFQPDFLAIGIETNEIHDAGPKTWQAYVALHKHVYAELKKDRPDLPVFASWTLHNMFKKRARMLESWKKLMPFNDVVAVSYYPFFVPDKDRLAALTWMTEQFDEFKKPYAMVETNDAAERLPLPKAKVVIEGTPEKQEAYYRALLDLAHRRDFAFVVSFVHQDYDALWEKIKDTSPELFMAWRDCGLLDETGKARPAFQVWRTYFDLPLRK